MISGDLDSVVHITKGECNGVGLAECAAYLAKVMPALLLQWYPAEYHSSRFFASLPPLSQSVTSFLYLSVKCSKTRHKRTRTRKLVVNTCSRG